MKIYSLLCFGMSLAISSNFVSASERSLFSSPSKIDSKTTNTSLNSLKNRQLALDSSIESMKFSNVNSELIDATYNSFILNMGPGKEFPVIQDESYDLDDETIAWSGKINVPTFQLLQELGLSDQMENPNQVIMIRRGERIYGEISLYGSTYELSTTEDGTAYMLVERNSKYALKYDDTPPTESKGMDLDINDASSLAAQALAPRIISILQGATTDAVAAIGGRNRMRDRMSFHLAQANQIMRNSGLTGSREIRFTNAGTRFPSVNDRANLSQTLFGLANTNDGFLDGFATTDRNNTRADMVGIITASAGNGNGAACGRASQIGSNRNNPFFAVSIPEARCPDSTGSVFLHEVGHLFGARHDNDPTNTPFAFGHGFSSAQARTSMAFDVAFGANLVLFLSDPQTRVNGVNIGRNGFSNVKRVFNEQSGRISRFR